MCWQTVRFPTDRRSLFVQAGSLLIGVRDLQDPFLIQRLSQQLQPNWQLQPALRLRETTRQADPEMPARLAAMVKMSARYICNGSEALSPSGKAGTGDVGEVSTSTF